MYNDNKILLDLKGGDETCLSLNQKFGEFW